MFHHDARDYDTAVGEAARSGRKRMEEIIEKGRTTAEALCEEVQTRTITDVISKASLIRYVPDEWSDDLSVGGELMPLHAHAKGQLFDNVGFPKKYAEHVMEESEGAEWGRELVAANVNAILSRRESQRNLVRRDAGDGFVKGFLSDRFKRLDSRPLLDAFLGACTETGLLPYEGVGCDTKLRVRAVLPLVFEPLPNEVMIFGAEFGNSDYGDGGVTLNMWTTRVWCTNLAITTKCLRKVHLGRRLGEFDFDSAISEQTKSLDAAATSSMIRDFTQAISGPDRVNAMLEAIRTAGEDEIRGAGGIDKVLERAVGNKSEFAQIRTLFDSPDVENLPPGRTLWRLSNAVSFFAQSAHLSPDRKLELQAVAGSMLAV